jgi:hypothetical protein
MCGEECKGKERSGQDLLACSGRICRKSFHQAFAVCQHSPAIPSASARVSRTLHTCASAHICRMRACAKVLTPLPQHETSGFPGALFAQKRMPRRETPRLPERSVDRRRHVALARRAPATRRTGEIVHAARGLKHVSTSAGPCLASRRLEFPLFAPPLPPVPPSAGVWPDVVRAVCWSVVCQVLAVRCWPQRWRMEAGLVLASKCRGAI